MSDLINKLQKEYKGIRKVEQEDKALVIFADDDTLWKILKDKRDDFNMEFEAGKSEENYIKIII
ncbi:MAG TPA: hypothetical protein VMC48_01215 [Methanobacterium sp.]|nr:hypothetical protein [Methanobacterium sp.]